MVVLSPSILVRGELQATEDLTIEGLVEGPVWCDGLAVTVAANAKVVGDIVARDITVFGSVSGTLVASEMVDVRPTASVTGRVVAGDFILADGGSFSGTVHPQHLKAALTVARHRHARRNEVDGTAGSPAADGSTPVYSAYDPADLSV
jgi:cytoskeletal protein CcmA (bactofilin family)